MKSELIMVGLHPKNRIQKERLLKSPHWLCMERAKFYTDSFKQTEGEDTSIRAAKAFRNIFENMTIKIYPEELLVGNRSSKHIAPPFACEKGDFNMVFEHLLPSLKKFGYYITPEHEKILFEEILPYWKGKTVRDMKVEKFNQKNLRSKLNFSFKEILRKIRAFGLSHILDLFADEPKPTEFGKSSKLKNLSRRLKVIVNLPRFLGALQGASADNVKGRGRCIDTQAHIVVGYKNVLKYGFKGIKEKAIKRAETAKPGHEKNVCKSIEMICDAIRDFSIRFAELAKKKADKTNDEERKRELLEIVRICENVPWNPAQNFYEAIQAIWFVQNAVIISYGAGSGITPGRVDQLLYPYYKKDIEEGKITRDFALRLLEEFIIKINNNVVIWPNIAGVRLNHLGSDIENITIGGLRPDGEDGTNKLSYLFIEAIRNTKLATSVSFRFSKKTPEEFWHAVCELHKDTNGPAFFNDEICIKAMMRDGYSLEAARDYCIVGCVEQSGNGDTYGATGGTKIYFPTILDMVLNRGRTTFFGNLDTIDTGNPEDFKTFDEFMNAFYIQLEKAVDLVATATEYRDDIWANNFHNPLISCTIDGCIESAKDMTEGGGHYKFEAVGGGGLGTVVDSLAAIKKFVYEDKIIKMKDLIYVLQNNYKNNEHIRQILKNGPKYGNDDDYTDSITSELVSKFCDIVNSKKLKRGGHFKGSLISYGLNIYEGALEPATPNGRKAGEPLSNSISPSNGAELNGPTAALKSVAKIDHTKIGYGDSLNMRFPGYLLKEKKGIESFATLVKTYFDLGGYHVQFNTIGTDTLRDAQLHPEEYEDLIVRVSGYSAYFTRLGKRIQDDLIERTDFCNCFI
ncbi:MAG: glycyl radical protein [Candidatus Helarchaeota archaeon]